MSDMASRVSDDRALTCLQKMSRFAVQVGSTMHTILHPQDTAAVRAEVAMQDGRGGRSRAPEVV